MESTGKFRRNMVLIALGHVLVIGGIVWWALARPIIPDQKEDDQVQLAGPGHRCLRRSGQIAGSAPPPDANAGTARVHVRFSLSSGPSAPPDENDNATPGPRSTLPPSDADRDFATRRATPTRRHPPPTPRPTPDTDAQANAHPPPRVPTPRSPRRSQRSVPTPKRTPTPKPETDSQTNADAHSQTDHQSRKSKSRLPTPTPKEEKQDRFRRNRKRRNRRQPQNPKIPRNRKTTIRQSPARRRKKRARWLPPPDKPKKSDATSVHRRANQTAPRPAARKKAEALKPRSGVKTSGDAIRTDEHDGGNGTGKGPGRGTGTNGEGSGDSKEVIAVYNDMIKTRFYDQWDPAGDGTAFLTIRVEKDGSVTKAALSTPSGVEATDFSVREAAGRVKKIEPLPAALAKKGYYEVTIKFSRTD